MLSVEELCIQNPILHFFPFVSIRLVRVIAYVTQAITHK